jgi:peptidyl-prolyl cis-trans isomerase C
VKKPTIICTLALAAATVAMAQDKPAAAPAAKPATPVPAAAPAAPTDPNAVIISAGTTKVTKAEFEGAVKTLPPEYQQFALGPGKKQFAEDYLRMKLLAAKGTEEGLQNDPDVQRQMDLMRSNLIATAELKKIEKNIAISDADVQAAYEANKKDYEQVHARHILIAPAGSPAAQPAKEGQKQLTDAEAKAKAEEIRAKIAAGGDFAALAKTESADVGSAANGGDLGSFGHGQMVPEFEQAAFAAKAGEVTPVVKTQFGYHIIKVESHELTPLDQVRPNLEKQLRQKKIQETLESMKAAANPTFDEAYFAVPKAPTTAVREDGEKAPAPTAPPATSKPATEKKPGTKKQ